jgi:hypothetical protein
VHECDDLGPSLAPLQLGLGIAGGAEGVGHALRSALHSQLVQMVDLLLSLDCKIAFNSISRQAIFHAAQEHAPALLSFLSLAYGSPSRVFPRGAPHDFSPVLSTSVVQQGDPLGPLLFALTLQGPLQRVAKALPAAQIVAHFDDINVVSPAAAAANAFALSIEVRTAGLTPVASKSAACSSKQDMATAAAAELGVLHARDGLVHSSALTHSYVTSGPASDKRFATTSNAS